VSSFQVFQPKYCLHFSYLPCPIHLILLDFITLKYLVKRTTYEAPHYAVFSSLPPLPPSKVQIFSSAPCSQTLSIYVLLLMLQTKFYTYTKQWVKVCFWMF
jgi:hypothetical protein